MEIKFIITIENKDYTCYRIVEGDIILNQTIYIENIGSEIDEAQYGCKKHPIESMESTAKFIASIIIKNYITKGK